MYSAGQVSSCIEGVGRYQNSGEKCQLHGGVSYYSTVPPLALSAVHYRAVRDRVRAFSDKFMLLFFVLKFSRIPGSRFSARLLQLCHVVDFCAKLPNLQNGNTAA